MPPARSGERVAMARTRQPARFAHNPEERIMWSTLQPAFSSLMGGREGKLEGIRVHKLHKRGQGRGRRRCKEGRAGRTRVNSSLTAGSP